MQLAKMRCTYNPQDFQINYAYSTTQIGDPVIFEETTYYIGDDLLVDHELKQFIDHERYCTANMKGYQADWNIEAQKIYLLKVMTSQPNQTIPKHDINSYYEYINDANDCVGHYRIKLESIYPEQSKVFANWYSGTISLRPYNPDATSLYSGITIKLSFEKGVLKRKVKIDNTEAVTKCGTENKQFSDWARKNKEKYSSGELTYKDWQPAPECAPDVVEDVYY